MNEGSENKTVVAKSASGATGGGGSGLKIALAILLILAAAGWIFGFLQLSKASQPEAPPEPPKETAKEIALQKELAQIKDQVAGLDEQLSAAQSELEKAKVKTEELDALREQERELAERLKKEVEDGKARVETIQGMLRVVCLESITFHTGSARITEEGKGVLDKIAETLKQDESKFIMVEGHTDNVPIGPATQMRYRTNWELSAARALSVVHYFQNAQEIDPARLAGVGYGEHQPVASNEDDEGRSQNRRVEILLSPKRAEAQ